MGALMVEPVTADRWDDLVALFGERGAYDGCWCMWWRIPSAEYSEQRGAGNRVAMRRLVADDERPGLIAYRDGRPVGWVSVAPREEFGRLSRSPTLKAVDDQPVWSIVCFYVDKSERGTGVGKALVRAAVRHARGHGATIVEGYPREPGEKWNAAEMFVGAPSWFAANGFEEVARRSERRPIVRRTIR